MGEIDSSVMSSFLDGVWHGNDRDDCHDHVPCIVFDTSREWSCNCVSPACLLGMYRNKLALYLLSHIYALLTHTQIIVSQFRETKGLRKK